MLAKSVELVCECGLEFLAGDVGELSFGDKGFRFGADEFLLEDDDLGRVGLLVLQLRDLIGDLLFAFGIVSLGFLCECE